MLKVFREKRDSLKWILWLLIVVLGAGMVLLFVDAPTASSGLFALEIARVRDRSIGIVEFRRQHAQLVGFYRQQLGDNFEQFAAQLNLAGQTVNSLITEHSIALHALDAGLSVPDSEIEEVVLGMGFKDEQGNFVGPERYAAVLRANDLTVTEFEENIRRGILGDKLRQLLTAGLSVPPADLRREFAKQEQQTRIHYVLFDPAEIDQDPDPAQLKKYFEDRPDAYRGEEQRQVQFFDLALRPDEIELNQEQIAERMENVDGQERIRASQILFKTKPNQNDPVKLKLARRVLRRLKKGASFEELARRHSEADSASRGGDLGFFPRGIHDEDFDKAAFRLDPGELSEVVQTAFGYHIIKVTLKPDSTEHLKQTLAEYQLREELSKERSLERSLGLLQRLKEGVSWDDVSADEDLEIRTTGLFPRDEMPSNIQVRSDFISEAFNLDPDGLFSQPYLTPTGYVVAGLEVIQPPQIPQFEEVAARVEEDFIEHNTRRLTQERADTLFTAARQSSLQEAARDQNLEATTTLFFKNGETVDDVIKSSPLMHARLPWMEAGDVSSPIRIAGKLMVFEVAEKTEQDEAIFDSRKDQIESTLTKSARNNFFNTYIKNVVDQLREDEQIRINQELLDQFSNN